MFGEPHIGAICSQHSRSWAVIPLSGIMHASSGAAVQSSMTIVNAIAAERRMIRV